MDVKFSTFARKKIVFWIDVLHTISLQNSVLKVQNETFRYNFHTYHKFLLRSFL